MNTLLITLDKFTCVFYLRTCVNEFHFIFPMSLHIASHIPHVSSLSLCVVYYLACLLILLVCCFYLLVQDGSTALMDAVCNGEAPVVALLAERGADLNLHSDVSKTNKT